ncbi:MAG: N-acetyl sugar amidotransferase [Calditrichaeota bacterium]|nr:MAG: N-acetyl sugar amidotransferase [Calditrichota bacterium]
MSQEYKICTRCIMDTSVPGIEFDDKGVCNFCAIHDTLEAEYPLNDNGKEDLEKLIDEIKASGKGKDYDCIIGVSGGTDSIYSLYMAKKYGLRPLAVHFDNGWNTEIAVSNIENATNILDIDLYTYVVNWEEFKDLQVSFLKASTPDAEAPTDMGIHAVLYRTAAEEGIKYSISGNSFRTEGVIPHSWGYKDGKYISSVQKIFGKVKLETFPNVSLFNAINYILLKRIKIVRLLNYLPYSKEEAKKVLIKEVGWKDYGGHHHESIYTRFFQSYYAPVKFNMDRRRVNYSAKARLGLMTREEGISHMKELSYDPEILEKDFEYIAKKFDLSLEEFKEIIALPPKKFSDYPTYNPMLQKLKGIIEFAMKMNLLPGLFQGGIQKR